MKIMVCSNVFGNFDILEKDADFADLVCIAGNLGISKEFYSFRQYLDGKLKIPTINFITGKTEDFGTFASLTDNAGRSYCRMPMAKDEYWVNFNYLGVPRTIFREDEFTPEAKFAGASGTYSSQFYEAESAPPRHLTKKDLFKIPEKHDIVLLHNVPGKLGKAGSLDFHEDLFLFIEKKQPRYIFVGGYDFQKVTSFDYKGTWVVFLPSLKVGYCIVNTDNWSCMFNNKIKE